MYIYSKTYYEKNIDFFGCDGAIVVDCAKSEVDHRASDARHTLDWYFAK